MRRPANPFIVSGYHSPAYFCDREAELAWLTEQFLNERNSVIHSWRRIGKTALLRHFFNSLESERGAETVFVDLLGTGNLNDAHKRIATAIVQRFGEPKKSIGAELLKFVGAIGATVGIDPQSGTPQLTFALSPQAPVAVSMEAMGKFLAGRKLPVIICLDEFQQIVNYPDGNSEAVFRTWVQDFPMVRFVFSGSHRNMMSSMFSETARPFYRSAQIKEIGPLPASEYKAFIMEKFSMGGKQIEEIQIDQTFQWARMQTYYIQLVCNKLYGRADRATGPSVAEVFDEIIQQEVPLLSSYQLLLTGFQWKLLVALARDENVENPMAQGFLTRHGLGAPSSVSAALRTLENKEFVISQGGKYTIHDTLLMRWLQKL
jgi:hypothetical protein